jgi:membrane protease YdiL (CAAX protease family)
MNDPAIEQTAPTSGAIPALPGWVGIATYFVLTFVASWAWWMAVAPLAGKGLPAQVRELLFLPGVFAPGILAVWMTAREEGRRGVDALLGRVLQWRVGAGWYLFAVGYLATAKLLAAAAYRLLRGTWPIFGTEPWYLLLAAVVLSAPFQAGEEFGWRGYALPRLTARLGLGPGSVVLGALWAAWHLPFFFTVDSDKSGYPFLPYLLSVTALSVAFAALSWRTNGSLLLAMLMHSAVNNTKDIVPSTGLRPGETLLLHTSVVSWLTLAVLWAGAAGLLAWMARDKRSRPRSAHVDET